MIRLLILMLAAVALGAGGCAIPSAPPDVAVAPDQYSAAFDAARDTLRRYQFELERVDARAGVITTRPKMTGGLATPWDRQQSTLAQEWEDFVNEQQRTVRITFEPAATDGSPPPPADSKPADLRLVEGPVTAHVDVVIERIEHTGRRLEPTAIRYSSITQDPDLVTRGLWPSYAVAFSQDPLLARTLAEEIRRTMPEFAPVTPTAPPAEPPTPSGAAPLEPHAE
jgi:hypothetical protein